MTTPQVVEILTATAVREIKDTTISIQTAMKISNGISILLTQMHNRKEISTATYYHCVDVLTIAAVERSEHEQ